VSLTSGEAEDLQGAPFELFSEEGIDMLCLADQPLNNMEDTTTTVAGLRSILNQQEESAMKSQAIAVLLGACALCLSIGTLSSAQEAKGPTQFNLAILDEDGISFVVPSAVIVDERGKVSGLTFTITNQTKKEQGFAIDKIHIKEVVKPGETKTIKVAAMDLDAVGTDQSVFPYYSHVDPKHIGGLLYIKR